MKKIWVETSLNSNKETLQCIAINIKDISKLLKAQQDQSDQMYQEAIETNYSHEQMTPLNSIIGNSNIVLRRFLEINTQALQLMPKVKDDI
jgi:signal transduction histidine kinase